jgi:hypothetical protein
VAASLITDTIVGSLNLSQFDLQAFRRAVPFLRTLRRATWRLAAVVSAIFLLVCAARAQQEPKPKVPGLDKIISAQEHLMFTGTIKSVDEKHNILTVNSVEGGDTEIFPIKHTTHVLTADGFRKKLDVLSPGVQVNVFYDQRSDRRTVTSIELYTSESKKKEPHS